MTPTQFKRPRTASKLVVEFRNKERGGPYLAGQIRWSDTNSDWDVVAAEAAA